jgi:hypothetical protein
VQHAAGALGIPPQGVPVVHVHAPIEQLCPAPHARPHIPQLVALDCVSTHTLDIRLQRAWPIGHAAHAPAVHSCAIEQTVPQPPQFAGSLAVAASQPFAAFMSQFAKPMLQAPSPHAPAAHAAAALAGAAQLRPHIPQLVTVVLVLVSQPFARFMSQLPKPAPHEIPQNPPPHVAVPPVLEHARPHAPQCATLTLVLVSHPLPLFMSQFAKPALQPPIAHAPPLHDALALAKEHAMPQRPQFVALVRVLVSQPLAVIPSQFSKPALQLAMRQVPAMHEPVPFAGAHPALHAPQCVRLVCRLTSQPFVGLPSQSAKPGSHVPTPHAPARQTSVALASEHARPHIPQLARFVARAVSHPSEAIRLQSPKPMAQATVHRPATHAAVAPAPPQTVVQLPQRMTSVWVSAQLPLQQLCPEGHGRVGPQPGVHPPARHTCPAGHIASVRHPVHRREAVSHSIAPPSLPVQSASVLQPIRHTNAKPSSSQ